MQINNQPIELPEPRELAISLMVIQGMRQEVTMELILRKVLTETSGLLIFFPMVM